MYIAMVHCFVNCSLANPHKYCNSTVTHVKRQHSHVPRNQRSLLPIMREIDISLRIICKIAQGTKGKDQASEYEKGKKERNKYSARRHYNYNYFMCVCVCTGKLLLERCYS